jgi:hypothetical protein
MTTMASRTAMATKRTRHTNSIKRSVRADKRAVKAKETHRIERELAAEFA